MSETPDAPATSEPEFATVDDLLGKPAAEEVVTVLMKVNGHEEPQPRKLLFRALPGDDYDALKGKFPPKPTDKTQGWEWDPERFPAALVAATLVRPQLSLEEVQAMWGSKGWSPGELGNLFGVAQALCLSGFNVPK